MQDGESISGNGSSKEMEIEIEIICGNNNWYGSGKREVK